MSEIPTIFLWIILLLVILEPFMFFGMLALCWRLVSGQHELAKLLVQFGPQSAKPSVAPVTLPTIPPKPVVQPKPSGPFDAAPKWFQGALHEIGFHETGNNQGIERYISMAYCGAPGDPWCAIFCNAMLESSGIPGTRSASSQSFRTHPNFVQLSGPALGAVVVFWRGSQTSGLGHVGFYRGESADSIWTLGGNENDMVQIEALPKDSATFGLIGYWWPKSVPLPTGGAVLMPTGSPVSIKVAPADATMPGITPAIPGKQTDIIATYFGGQQSAYGGPIIDNSPGVALPFHFTGARPKVRVTGKRSGLSIECEIVDVGPWNTNDPYWQTGARPQSETGTDSRGRHTNKAGIDLTLAAATAIDIDGKGLCDWQFVESPLATPTVT